MIAIFPMAGRGSRFTERGYDIPKPLIEVSGKLMLTRALQSLDGVNISKLVVIALQDHQDRYNLRESFNDFPVPVHFVFLDNVTEGQLCTVLAARDIIPPEEDILICPSDTLVISRINDDIMDLVAQGAEGVISVYNLPGNRWSFALTDDFGWVQKVTEKERISDDASTGIYYFRRFGEFCRLADQMIKSNERTKGEFYIMPLYQKYIDAGKKIGVSRANEMWDMGTPESKEYFERNYDRI